MASDKGDGFMLIKTIPNPKMTKFMVTFVIISLSIFSITRLMAKPIFLITSKKKITAIMKNSPLASVMFDMYGLTKITKVILIVKIMLFNKKAAEINILWLYFFCYISLAIRFSIPISEKIIKSDAIDSA